MKISCIFDLSNKQKQLKLNKMTSIKTLSTRSICDHNCIFTAELLEIKGNFAIIFFDKKIIKRKIMTSYDGKKYIFPNGKYSMCPTFDL
jgi:hypothetical protein